MNWNCGIGLAKPGSCRNHCHMVRSARMLLVMVRWWCGFMWCMLSYSLLTKALPGLMSLQRKFSMPTRDSNWETRHFLLVSSSIICFFVHSSLSSGMKSIMLVVSIPMPKNISCEGPSVFSADSRRLISLHNSWKVHKALWQLSFEALVKKKSSR